MGKRGPKATVNLFFLGLGWPWVGEFVGLILIFVSFPTQQDMVYRKHPSRRSLVFTWYSSTTSVKMQRLQKYIFGGYIPNQYETEPVSEADNVLDDDRHG